MTILKMKEYGISIDSDDQCDKVVKQINTLLSSGKVEIDFNDVVSITTYSAKSIFGRIYIQLGEKKFYENIIISKANEDFKIIIQEGILSALEDLS